MDRRSFLRTSAAASPVSSLISRWNSGGAYISIQITTPSWVTMRRPEDFVVTTEPCTCTPQPPRRTPKEPPVRRFLFGLAWLTACCFVTLTVLVPVPVIAGEWPQWRGPNRDGVVDDTGLVNELPEGQLPRRWEVEIGSGYSGPTAAGGRVYVMDRGRPGAWGDVERVRCFDAATGKQLWQHEYAAPYTVNYTAGPRASVTLHDGKAYAVGAMGHFHCFRADTGEIVWARDLGVDYDVSMPTWGIAASPLIFENLVIQVAAGRGNACVVAFDAESGEERWTALDEQAGYSSPILIRQGDQDVVVCWTGESVSGLNPATGQVHWSLPMRSRNMPIGITTPVVQDNRLFVSSFYDGSMMVRLDPKRPAAEVEWRRVGQDEKNTDSLHCMIGTPLLKGDFVYGVDSYGELRCLDIRTGDRVWEDLTAVPTNRWATIHILRRGDREIMLNDRGELILGQLTPQGFQEESRAMLISPTTRQLPRRDGVVWSHPAIADGHIFARNDESLICVSLKVGDE